MQARVAYARLAIRQSFRRREGTGLVALLLAAGLVLAGCGRGPGGAVSPAPAPPMTAARLDQALTPCTAALAAAGVRDTDFSVDGDKASYAVPSAGAAPLQGGTGFALRDVVSAAAGLPLDSYRGKTLTVLRLTSRATAEARARNRAADRSPEVLYYECARDDGGRVAGLWGLADPTIEPGGLIGVDGRTLAQVEHAPATYDDLVKAAGYDAAADERLPADGTALEALLAALGRLNRGDLPGPLIPMHGLTHLVPLQLAGGCALGPNEVVHGLTLWPEYGQPFDTAALAGNGSEYLEWTLKRTGPGGLWTLAGVGTGGGCSASGARGGGPQPGPLPTRETNLPAPPAFPTSGPGAALVAFHRATQQGDCTAAYSLTTGQMRFDAGGPAGVCPGRLPPAIDFSVDSVVARDALRAVVLTTSRQAGGRTVRAAVETVLEGGVWKLAASTIIGGSDGGS